MPLPTPGPNDVWGAQLNAYIDSIRSSTLVVTPEQFGAVGGGAVNDTAAIQAAVDAVAANGGGTVLFGAGSNYGQVYLVDSAPRHDRRGNSIIALPETGSGTIILCGLGKSSTGSWSWLKTTRTTDTYSGTYGPPSVVGGPTTENSTGSTIDRFSKWNVVIDGLGIGLPDDPKLAGYDFGKMNTAKAQNFSVFTTTLTVEPTAGYAFGLRMPSSLCSGNMPVDGIQVFGMYAGLVLSSPHTDVRAFLTKWCKVGIGISDDVDAAVGDAHASKIGYWDSANTTYHLSGWNVTAGAQQNGVGTTTRLDIDLWDIEDHPAGPWYATAYHILDQYNTLRGTARWNRTLGGVGPTDADLTVFGAEDYSLQLMGGLNLTGPHRSYTATVGGTGWALGNGTQVSRWTQRGKTIDFTVEITFGSTSTFGAGGMTVSLPKARVGVASRQLVHASMVDVSAPKAYIGQAEIGNGSSSAAVRCITSAAGEASSVVSSAPFTWASGDQVTISGSYEVA